MTEHYGNQTGAKPGSDSLVTVLGTLTVFFSSWP